MAHEVYIHPVQTGVLRELLFADAVSFAELQKTTTLTSDHFKFHLRRLVTVGYVEKESLGRYRLTQSGKEYANKLDTATSSLERQPKSAVILVVERSGDTGQLLLLQRRKKHPYFGFWGFPGGKIRWGETIVTAAERELWEESRLTATFDYRGVYHEQVIAAESGLMLEDKIFHILLGRDPRGELQPTFDSGDNVWMSLVEARAQERRYVSLDIEARIGLGDERFIERVQTYGRDEF